MDTTPRDPAQVLLNAVDDALLLVQPTGEVVSANAMGGRLAASPTAAKELVAMAQAAAQGGLVDRPLVTEGRAFAARARRLASGQVLLTLRDESAEHARQVQIVQSEQLASVGRLASAVGHEMANPSAFVTHNLRALVDSLGILAGIAADPSSVAPLPEVVDEFVGEARAILGDCQVGMERIHTMVRDLRSLIHGDDDPAAQADANAVVESSVALVRAELRHRTRVDLELKATLPVRCSAPRIGQVLISLLTNAAQALDERQYRRNRIRIRTVDERPNVVIEVSDNGRGIPPDVLPHIFDYLFTTKPAGVGTGLGLTIANHIVQSAGGKLLVESAPAAGSTFKIVLPAIRTVRPSQQRMKAVQPTTPPRRPRVLVVDDEVLLLKAYRRMLGKSMDVEVAEDAQVALELLDTDRRFDVILCDLSMPKMTGVEFLAVVEKRWPELARRFVFATGGAVTAAARRFLEHTPLPWIEKPVAHERLMTIIEQVSAA